MSSAIFISAVAFLACIVLTPFVRALSLRHGVMDLPDMARKIHRLPIPRTGGIAIALAYSLAICALAASPFNVPGVADVPLMVGILPAVFIVFATGLVDDVFGLPPWTKLAGQVVAACVAYWGGVQVFGFAGIAAHGWFALPATVIWLVVCANAFNLIDGVDGLAAGVGLVAASTTLFAAAISDNLPLVLAVAPLVGALLAFLRYNFNPATIFLGDCGSLSIGFLLGCYAAVWGQKATTLMGMTAPLMALALPLFDTGLAVARRFLRHQPIFMSDSNHIHHRLLARGFAPRDVALALCGVGALASGFALFQTATHSRYGGLVVVAFGGVAWLGVRSLGYLEFQTASYMASTGVFRHILRVQVYCREVETKLAAASTPDDYWEIVRAASRSFGFVSVRMRLDGRPYESIGAAEAAAPPGHDVLCRIRIPLREDEFVEFAHLPDSSAQHAVVVSALTDILQRELGVQPRPREEPADGAAASAPATPRAAETSLVDTP